MSNNLTSMQDRLYQLLLSRAATDATADTLILVCYDTVYPGCTRGLYNRQMQQRLGPLIARVNRRLVGQRIEPGRMKNTYRLNLEYKG